MLKATIARMPEDTPLRRAMLRLIKRRLATRIGVEAHRGWSIEEVQLRLGLDAEEAEEVVAFGVENNILVSNGEIVRKNLEEGVA